MSDYKQIIMGYEGEVALKGLNRRTFEKAIAKNLRRRLSPLGEFDITVSQSTFFISPKGDSDMVAATEIAAGTFGLSSVSCAYILPRDFELICKEVPKLFKEELSGAKTFKVMAKRADKDFALKSPEICAELGGVILDNFSHLSVDVKKPEAVVFVEIRDGLAYLHTGKKNAVGGMPVGTSGRAMVLLSGGIDSPVAAYLAAKRGLALSAVHFSSPPYTSVRAQKKVERLAELVSKHAGSLTLSTVSFTPIGEELRKNVPEELHTIIMRRSMVRIADIIAKANGCDALITGESLAQVASQTLKGLCCSDAATDMLILRPLICNDKVEISAIAQKIGTFETSIEPYEDCCTIFTPPHPKTKPEIAEVLEAEKAIPNLAELEFEAATTSNHKYFE